MNYGRKRKAGTINYHFKKKGQKKNNGSPLNRYKTPSHMPVASSMHKPAESVTYDPTT